MAIFPYDGAMQPDDIEAPLTEVPSAHVPRTGVHLYHMSMSYYSQIARLALEEARVQWTSHAVLILAYEQYSPAYVRINPRCVVPTLATDGKVTTDAYNIVVLSIKALTGRCSSPKRRTKEFAWRSSHSLPGAFSWRR